MQDLGTRYEEVVSLTDTIVNRLNRFIANIKPLNVQVQNETAAYLDTLTKPPGSLGKLESLAIQLAGITGNMKPSFTKNPSLSWLVIMESVKKESAPFRLR